MKKFALIEETLGYQSAADPTNVDIRFLATGSKNILIDRQRKARTRAGYSVLGATNTALTPVRTATTWNTSTGTELPLRNYDDELEVYLTTIDTYAINAWTRVKSSFSTTEKLRYANWFDTGENLDLTIMVNGDDNLYEWNGAVAVVSSITGTTVTKKGTTTFAQNRFYTTRNKTFVCVRTGTEYTYTGGETSTTLTGIADTAGLQENDILVQKVIATDNKPASGRNNHTIFDFENQLCVGSEDDEEVYISQNDDYDDFSYSSPRVAGEGALLTLDNPTTGFGSIGQNLLVFAGRSSIFRANYEQIAVGSTLAETLRVKRLEAGVDQGAINHEAIVSVGNSLIYVSHEPALRMIDNPDNLAGINPKTLSNPIKPDFDADTFTNASVLWYKNAIHITGASNMFILEFVEDADGTLRRFWQTPQSYPVGPLSIIGSRLYGHSNSVAESYLLFEGLSDRYYEGIDPLEKLPIHHKAVYSYRTDKRRANLKAFDEYYVEGEISSSVSELTNKFLYDYGGATASVEETINGTDEDIIFETIQLSSLGQSSLGTQPLGGSTEEAPDAHRFRIIHEMAKEDYHELQVVFETNDVDQYWAILAHGPNSTLSTRQNTIIKK